MFTSMHILTCRYLGKEKPGGTGWQVSQSFSFIFKYQSWQLIHPDSMSMVLQLCETFPSLSLPYVASVITKHSFPPPQLRVHKSSDGMCCN